MGKTTVSPTTVLDLLNSPIKLPAYQRAKRWDNKKKFQLLLSVLCDFPIGSVVLHREKDAEDLWLMDGQQRRAALNEMCSAKQFRNIFLWMDEVFTTEVDTFEDKLRIYVLNEFLKATTDAGEVEDFEYDPLDWHQDADKGEKEGKEYLRQLVRLRRRIGKRTSKKYTETSTSVYPFETLLVQKGWFEEGRFPFRKDGEFDPAAIHDFVYKYRNDSTRNHQDANDFISYFHDEAPSCEWLKDSNGNTDKKKILFTKSITEHYEDIIEIINISYKIRKKIESHNLGKIEYEEDSNTVSSGYDLPSIFRFINDLGAPMEDVELFASAGRWVGTSAQPTLTEKMKERTLDLISELKIHDASAPTTKWHICCVYSKAFYEINSGGSNSPWWLGYQKKASVAKTTDPKSMRAGFILFSLFHSDSVSKVDWSSTFKIGKDEDAWKDETALSDYSEISKLVMSDQYFERLFSWKRTIPELSGEKETSRDIGLLTAGIRQIWLNQNRPKAASQWSNRKNFILETRKLFDYFVYQKIGKMMIPAGGGDQALKDGIANIRNGIIPKVESSDWTKLIEKIIDEGLDLNNEDYTSKDVRPSDSAQAKWSRILLTHIYSINGLAAPGDDEYHVDHIVPKEKWQEYFNTLDEHERGDKNHTNNLVNLCLLDKDTNAAKNDKGLDHESISNNIAMKSAIVKYAGIPESKFSDFANANDDTYNNLKNERIEFLKTDFLKNRKEKFLKDETWK